MPLSATEIQDYLRQFFVLQEGFLRGALRVAPVGRVREPCALTRGERTARKPVPLKPDEGARPLDLVGATWPVLTIVSRYVIAALESERFTGWATYPVELHGVGADAYHGLAVHGRCGGSTTR